MRQPLPLSSNRSIAQYWGIEEALCRKILKLLYDSSLVTFLSLGYQKQLQHNSQLLQLVPFRILKLWSRVPNHQEETVAGELNLRDRKLHISGLLLYDVFDLLLIWLCEFDVNSLISGGRVCKFNKYQLKMNRSMFVALMEYKFIETIPPLHNESKDNICWNYGWDDTTLYTDNT